MQFTSHVNLPEEARERLVYTLNRLLATSIDLHWQVKQAHWNIRGKNFLSRHELFDDLADHARKQADELAERAGTLGGYAEGTIRLAAQASHLPEYDLEAVRGDAHLKALVERFARLGTALREGIRVADDVKDPVTVDLLTRTLGEVELDLWFLESHLNGDEQSPRRSKRPQQAEKPADGNLHA